MIRLMILTVLLGLFSFGSLDAAPLVQKLNPETMEMEYYTQSGVKLDPDEFNLFKFKFWKGFYHRSAHVFTAPFRWNRQEWITFGKLVALNGAFSALDEPVRDGSQSFRSQLSDNILNFGDELGGNNVWLPLGYSMFFGNFRLRRTTYLSIEAAAITKVIFTAMNEYTDRGRPKDGPGESLGDAFPSGHASFAWSVATVVGTEYNELWYVKYPAYVIAWSVTLARINSNVHWLTDVSVGSMIGYYVGKSVTRWGTTPDDPAVDKNGRSFSLIPVIAGDRVGLAASIGF